jgi:ParB family chromosome partitioning protein
MLAQHSSRSNEHYTPPEICDLAREVLGGSIDLDPASCAQANTLVRAARYYTAEDNGLALPWTGTVFLNPPGNEIEIPGQGRVSQAALWWVHLVTRYQRGDVKAAVFVIFNLELLRHTQAWPVPQPLDYTTCLPRDRLYFYRPGDDGVPQPSTQPTHPSGLVYLGPESERFFALFGPVGYCCSRQTTALSG